MGVGVGWSSVCILYYTCFSSLFSFFSLIYISYVLGNGKIGHHSSASRGVGEEKKGLSSLALVYG